MGGLDPAWIALIGTLCGGVGLKMLEHWLGKSKVKVDEASKIREELRLEIASLKDEVSKLENELNTWRDRYLDLRDTYTELQTQYTITLSKINDDLKAVEEANKT